MLSGGGQTCQASPATRGGCIIVFDADMLLTGKLGTVVFT